MNYNRNFWSMFIALLYCSVISFIQCEVISSYDRFFAKLAVFTGVFLFYSEFMEYKHAKFIYCIAAFPTLMFFRCGYVNLDQTQLRKYQ